MTTIPFKCPSCGGTQLAVSTEPKSYEDLIGARCAGCGHVVTDDDIRQQAVGIMAERVRAMLKGR